MELYERDRAGLMMMREGQANGSSNPDRVNRCGRSSV